jgi:hypothetical protein
MRGLAVVGLLGIVTCAVLASGEREAQACGGCFHPESTPQKPLTESTVVSDHRMVFALSSKQTILWDQIKYSGNPSEFAWVLPVRQGTTIDLSHDEWIQALDLTTQPKIIQPQARPFGGFSGGGDDYGSGGGGCGCGFMSSADSLASAGSDRTADGGAAPPAPPPVQVIAQEVVGPYETVTVRSDKPKALEDWLHAHGYAVPDAIQPIIAAYTAEKLDFIALRLRPGQGVSAMRPVRIVSPGADPTLPLRMVAAGIGANVAITLYVISEGRYRPSNFPEGQIDDTKLLWDTATSRSRTAARPRWAAPRSSMPTTEAVRASSGPSFRPIPTRVFPTRAPPMPARTTPAIPTLGIRMPAPPMPARRPTMRARVGRRQHSAPPARSSVATSTISTSPSARCIAKTSG